MSTDAFDSRRSGFEAEYFHNKDAQLVRKLKQVFESKSTADDLRKATGISNQEVIDRLMKVIAKGELLLAFRLYPLVEVAWADGKVDADESAAVIEAAQKLGVPPGSSALTALKDWITRGPTEDGRTAWYALAGELRSTLSKDELDTFRRDLLDGAKSVASASGGILGIAFEISPSEKRVLDGIAKALT